MVAMHRHRLLATQLVRRLVGIAWRLVGIARRLVGIARRLVGMVGMVCVRFQGVMLVLVLVLW
jgi:hypothetical protein